MTVRSSWCHNDLSTLLVIKNCGTLLAFFEFTSLPIASSPTSPNNGRRNHQHYQHRYSRKRPNEKNFVIHHMIPPVDRVVAGVRQCLVVGVRRCLLRRCGNASSNSASRDLITNIICRCFLRLFTFSLLLLFPKSFISINTTVAVNFIYLDNIGIIGAIANDLLLFSRGGRECT